MSSWWNSLEEVAKVNTWAQVAILLFGILTVIATTLTVVASHRISALQSADAKQLQERLSATESSAESLTKELAAARGKLVSGNGTLKLQFHWNVLGPVGDAAPAETWKSVTTGNQGYVAFVKSDRPIFVMRSTNVVSEATSENLVTVTAFLDLNAPESFAVALVPDLPSADFAQIQVPDVPPNTRLLGGEFSGVLNGNVRIVLRVPMQTLEGERIVVRNLAGNLSITQ